MVWHRTRKMCSSTTFKFLCYFYACCNTFCAISIAVGADKVSEKITRDNCTSISISSSGTKPISAGSHTPGEICNKKTYGALVFMLALGCFMSLLMVVGVALNKQSLIKAFRVFLYFNMIFLFGCWFSIFRGFHETNSSMLMLLWGFVLVLCIVYFGMQVWITSGAYEAVTRKLLEIDAENNLRNVKISNK